jgi:hypothetical protein
LHLRTFDRDEIPKEDIGAFAGPDRYSRRSVAGGLSEIERRPIGESSKSIQARVECARQKQYEGFEKKWESGIEIRILGF